MTTYRVARASLAVALLLVGLGGCVDLVHNDDPSPEAVAAVMALAEPRRTDVALVLGCPSDDVTGEASPCQRCRVKSALRAYRDGEVAGVIFSGGAAHNRFVEAEVMGRLAARRGLALEAMELEGSALTTWMNLRLSRRIMRRRGWETALVVSTAAHLPRARRFVEHFGIPARYRACDRDLPPDSDGEWTQPLRRAARRSD